jgi:hypothetical protein
VQFEFQPKSERLNLRVPKGLLDAVKAAAASAGIPYQRYIRQTLEARRPAPAQREVSRRLPPPNALCGIGAELVEWVKRSEPHLQPAVVFRG